MSGLSLQSLKIMCLIMPQGVGMSMVIVGKVVKAASGP